MMEYIIQVICLPTTHTLTHREMLFCGNIDEIFNELCIYKNQNNQF